MSGTDGTLTVKDMTNRLNIGDSTLRKWCLSLEEHGYNFYRTDQNKRIFTQQDLIVLQQFQKLVQEKNMSMNNASLVVTAKYKKEPFSNETEIEQTIEQENNVPLLRSDNELFERLLTHIEHQEQRQKQQEEFNKALLKKLDEQQKYIEERLNRRDETLIQSLREVQETKKLIATAEEKREEESKKGLFARLFGK
jgi:hypothetical protein